MLINFTLAAIAHCMASFDDAISTSDFGNVIDIAREVVIRFAQEVTN